MAIKESSRLPQASLQYIHGICSELILAVGRSRGVVRAICSAKSGRRLEYSRRGCAARPAVRSPTLLSEPLGLVKFQVSNRSSSGRRTCSLMPYLLSISHHQTLAGSPFDPKARLRSGQWRASCSTISPFRFSGGRRNACAREIRVQRPHEGQKTAVRRQWLATLTYTSATRC
jgi:hypothetical protein